VARTADATGLIAMTAAVAAAMRTRWTRMRAVFTRSHFVPEAYRPKQATLVWARIRVLAPVVAVLTLAWIPIDAIGLEPAEMARILPLRLALAAALLVLARVCTRLSSHLATRLFVWLQALGFGAMQLCLDPAQDSVLRLGYGLFPFLITAQLAVFPLPWGITVRAAMAAVALLLAPQVLGYHPPDAGLWNDLWLLGLIIALAAWASHAQLSLLIDLLGARRDASHDPLTALANRRSAVRRLEAERAHTLRHGEPLSVLMIDLDHFKRVNDRWGHAGGDLVLVATAQVLRDELRGADLGARYGGEEFLAILPSTAPAQAMEVAERIRERIARLAVAVPGATATATATASITASIGIATLESDESATALVARADAALYRAKAEGRNRCVIAAPAEPAEPARIPNAPD